MVINQVADEGGFEVVGTMLEAAAVPLGSKFGESGERLRSARIRSARSARSRPVSALR